MLTALILCGLALDATTPVKLAVAPLAAGDGTTAGVVDGLSESFTAELRRQSGYQVLAYSELQAVLSHEQLAQLVGCADDSCLAQVGSAAGAAGLATGRVGKVGQSWLISLKLIDVTAVKVVAAADRRLKGGTVDDVLDVMPGMVGELLEKAQNKLGTVSAPPVAAVANHPVATFSGDEPPAAAKDLPYEGTLKATALSWVGDGKGHYIAFDAEQRHHGPLFAGDGTHLYAQRVNSGGASGKESWNATFWDGRITDGWRRSFEKKKSEYSLRCDETVVAYHPVSKAEQQKLIKKATLHAVRWQRTARALARDDAGTYFFVDQAVAPRNNSDYRLFVGTKGRLRYLALDDAIIDGNSSVFISSQGRFVVRKTRDGEEAVWVVGDSEKKLTQMNLFQQAPMVYTSLGAYTGQALGTPCDPFFK